MLDKAQFKDRGAVATIDRESGAVTRFWEVKRDRSARFLAPPTPARPCSRSHRHLLHRRLGPHGRAVGGICKALRGCTTQDCNLGLSWPCIAHSWREAQCIYALRSYVYPEDFRPTRYKTPFTRQILPRRPPHRNPPARLDEDTLTRFSAFHSCADADHCTGASAIDIHESKAHDSSQDESSHMDRVCYHVWS